MGFLDLMLTRFDFWGLIFAGSTPTSDQQSVQGLILLDFGRLLILTN